MKSLTSLIALLFFIEVANAQTHISKSEYARYNCRLAPKRSNNMEKLMCPACDREDNAAKQRKIAEDNAADQANKLKDKQKKAADDIAFNKFRDAISGKSTEVLINGNNSNSGTTNTSTNTYIMPPPNTATSASASAEATTLAYQAVGEQLATALVDLFSPSAAKLQRRAAEAAADRKERANKEADFKKREYDEFRINYWPLMNKAENGDETARMILYFSSSQLSNMELVPDRWKWLERAVSKNNQDAILEKSGVRLDYRPEIFEDSPYYIQQAAYLGNVDAMIILANWYNRSGSTVKGGNNPRLALEWYGKAAAKGSPNAMGCLGMIYKYGRTADLSGSGTNYLKKIYVKYDVVLDEKIAFEWFTKSLQPDYVESLFGRAINTTGGDFSECHYSYFNPTSYVELARIYKSGKVVLKDKLKAKEFEQKAEAYTTKMMNRQKFSILFR